MTLAEEVSLVPYRVSRRPNKGKFREETRPENISFHKVCADKVHLSAVQYWRRSPLSISEVYWVGRSDKRGRRERASP